MFFQTKTVLKTLTKQKLPPVVNGNAGVQYILTRAPLETSTSATTRFSIAVGRARGPVFPKLNSNFCCFLLGITLKLKFFEKIKFNKKTN